MRPRRGGAGQIRTRSASEPQMFIAGIRRLDRTRGDGWLDCPNCGEHASQDVVDQMRFAGLGFYRFAPVARTRILICKRCNFKREASAEEMGRLRTVGRGVARAVMFPIGLLPFFLIAVLVVALATRSAASDSGISYSDIKLDPIAPATLKLPTSYNHSALPSSDPINPPVYVASDATGILIIRLRHYLVNDSAANILAQHFNDDVGLNANGFPTDPPKTDKVSIGGVDGLKAQVDYSQSNQQAVISYYAFNKDGNSYILSFQELGTSGVAEAKNVESTVAGNLTFNGKATPAPSPSPSAGGLSGSGSTPTSPPSSSSSSSSSTSS